MKFRQQQITAAKSRIKDTSLKITSDLQTLAVNYLSKIKQNELPRLKLQSSGSILQSFVESEYLKDTKFQIHLQNLKCIKVNEEVLKAVKSNFANINKIKQELATLSSEIKEEELRTIQNFTKVHFNNFQRPIDQNLNWGDKRCLKDYKTGFSFLENQLMKNNNGLGLTLPIKSFVKIPSPKISIVHEETDSGDTIKPLKVSDPQNLDRKNKSFFYVIAKRSQDKSSRNYKEKVLSSTGEFGSPKLTIELEFSSVVQLNYIELEPISNSKLFILENAISYISGNGDKKSIENVQVVESSNLKILFEPVRASSIRFSLSAPSVSGRKILNNNGDRERALNKLLSESPMSVRVLPEQELLASRVFDFSLKQASVGLCSFYPKGIFRSKNEMIVNSPLGFAMSYQAREIRESFDFDISQKCNPIDDTVYETYVHAKLYGGSIGSDHLPITMGKPTEVSFNKSPGTLVLDAMIPMLDSGLLQHEYMEFIENKSKIKLFPNTRHGLSRVRIKSIKHTLPENYVLRNDKVYDLGNIANFYETLSSLTYESTEQELIDYCGEINVVPGTIAKDFGLKKFSEERAEDLKARESIESALMSITAEKRGNGSKITYNYLPPDDSDLEFLLGQAWVGASLEEKEKVRSKPEDYLLLSDEIIYSRNLNSSEGAVFCKSCVADSDIISNWLGNALYATKMVCLTGASTGLTYHKDTNTYIITVQINVVKQELSLNQEALWFGVNPHKALSLEEKYAIHRVSRINHAARRLRSEVLQHPRLDSATYSNRVNLYKYAIYNGVIAVKKENMVRGDTLGLNARVTDYYWAQEFANSGTNSYKIASFVSKTSLEDFNDLPLSTVKKACGINESINTSKAAISNSKNYSPLRRYGQGGSLTLDIETFENHGLSTGDEFGIISAPSSYGGCHVVSAVKSPKVFQIKRFSGVMPTVLGADPDASDIDLKFENVYCLKKSFSESPINVFSNETPLKIGVDYYLSLNKGSEWFSTIPLDSTYEDFMAKSEAGSFYIMIKPGVGTGAFSIKYNVKRDQYLEPSKMIYLKNGRVTCSKELLGSSGTLRAVIISRTRSLHPYITPILENYKLCVQENPGSVDNSGKVFSNEMIYTNRKKTTDVG